MEPADIDGETGQQLGSFGEMVREATQMIPHLIATELTRGVLNRNGYLEGLKA